MDFESKTNLELRILCEQNGLDGSKGGRNDLIARLKTVKVVEQAKKTTTRGKKKVETAAKAEDKETR